MSAKILFLFVSLFVFNAELLAENLAQNSLNLTQNSAILAQNSSSQSYESISYVVKDDTPAMQNSNGVQFPNTMQNYSTQNSSTSRNFSVELGLGYVNTRFAGAQSAAGHEEKVKSTTSHGVDVFVNGVYQPMQYFGISFGLLWEFLPIKWRGQGLVEPDSLNSAIFNADTNSEEYNGSEFLFNAVLTLGFISDIYKSSSNSVRLFANIGAGTSYLLNGSKYEGEVSEYTITASKISYKSETALIPMAFSVPVNFGVRFIFAKAHGIELVGKVELVDKTYKYKYASSVATMKTTISRDMSFGLRYVYRFLF